MRALLVLVLLAPFAAAEGGCMGPLCWSESGTEETVCRNASESATGTTRVYTTGAFVEGHQRCENGTQYRNVLLVAPGTRATWTSFSGAGSTTEVEAIAPGVFVEWKCYSTGATCGIAVVALGNGATRATPTGPPAPPALPWGHLVP